jgi:hypothetical protein
MPRPQRLWFAGQPYHVNHGAPFGETAWVGAAAASHGLTLRRRGRPKKGA